MWLTMYVVIHTFISGLNVTGRGARKMDGGTHFDIVISNAMDSHYIGNPLCQASTAIDGNSRHVVMSVTSETTQTCCRYRLMTAGGRDFFLFVNSITYLV